MHKSKRFSLNCRYYESSHILTSSTVRTGTICSACYRHHRLITHGIMYSSTNSACKKVTYDFYVLALTWPNEFCNENTCSRDWKQKWNGKSLSIHGFWPSSTDLSYLSCFKENSYDPYCRKDYDFNLSQFSND